MSMLRRIDTPEGPAVLIPSGGAALRVCAQLRTLLAERPSQVPDDPVLGPLYRLCAVVEEQRRQVGFVETQHDAEVGMLGVSDVARALGVSAQAVRKACRAGRYPGARQDANRRWSIPESALTSEEPHAA